MIPSIVLGIAFLRFFSPAGLSGTMTALIVSHAIVVFGPKTNFLCIGRRPNKTLFNAAS